MNDPRDCELWQDTQTGRYYSFVTKGARRKYSDRFQYQGYTTAQDQERAISSGAERSVWYEDEPDFTPPAYTAHSGELEGEPYRP